MANLINWLAIICSYMWELFNRWMFYYLLQGTTGNPKGTALSHHNIVNNAKYVAEVLEYDKVVSVITCRWIRMTYKCDLFRVTSGSSQWNNLSDQLIHVYKHMINIYILDNDVYVDSQDRSLWTMITVLPEYFLRSVHLLITPRKL